MREFLRLWGGSGEALGTVSGRILEVRGVFGRQKGGQEAKKDKQKREPKKLITYEEAKKTFLDKLYNDVTGKLMFDNNSKTDQV